MNSARRRWRALGGVIGPAAFIGAWFVLGLRREGYSPARDPISRLAAIDASSRWAMTAGFVAFGTGVSIYATELRTAMPGRAAHAALTCAVATVGIAVTPLGSALGGTAHATCVGVAYAALAATPILGGRSLAAQGYGTAAKASAFAGMAIGATLLASVVSPTSTGLLQRIGLTVGNAWIVASALRLFRSRPRSR